MTRFLALLLTVWLAVPQQAHAIANLIRPDYGDPKGVQLGKTKVNFNAGVIEHYDSNIYLVPEDQPDGTRVGGGVLGSFITEGRALATFQTPLTDMHGFFGGANLQSFTYEKQPSANDAFNYGGQLGYRYQGPMGLTAKLWDTYINTQDPAFSEIVARERRWQNTAGLLAEYAPEGGKLYLAILKEHTTHRYLNPTLARTLDRYEQTGGVRVGYQLQPKTNAYVGYRRQVIHYSVGVDPNHPTLVDPGIRNNKGHLVDVGVEGKNILPKVSGRVSAGAVFRDYDNQNAPRSYARDFTVSTDVSYKPRERCTFNLRYTRGLIEAFFGSNNFYHYNDVVLEARHRFPFGLTARVGAGFGIDRFSEATNASGTTTGTGLRNRRDDRHTQYAALEYAIQDRVHLGASYQHTQRNSNFSGQFNYERHLTSLSLRVGF